MLASSALLLNPPFNWFPIVDTLVPGAHLLLINDVKTHHANTVTVEDSGLEVRDTIAWVFSKENGDVGLKLITVARKPLEGTVAANVLEHGTGALNVDGCRVEGVPPSVPQPVFNSPTGRTYGMKTGEGRNGEMSQAAGRWPANLTHDSSPSVVTLFPEAKSGCGNGGAKVGEPGDVTPLRRGTLISRKDSGSAARFFYDAPSVDDLIAYLLKLITPPGGTVLTDCDISKLPDNYNYVSKLCPTPQPPVQLVSNS